MKATHRTPRKENPGAGGRGPSRQRAHAFMASKTKEQWASEAIDMSKRIEMLESIVRRIPNYPAMVVRYARGEKSWANQINELERDVEAALPGLFQHRLST